MSPLFVAFSFLAPARPSVAELAAEAVRRPRPHVSLSGGFPSYGKMMNAKSRPR